MYSSWDKQSTTFTQPNKHPVGYRFGNSTSKHNAEIKKLSNTKLYGSLCDYVQ